VRLLPKDALTSELGFPELLLAAYASVFASVLAQAFPRWDLWAHPGHEPPPAVPSRCEGLSAQATPDPCGEHRPEDLRAAHESGEALVLPGPGPNPGSPQSAQAQPDASLQPRPGMEASPQGSGPLPEGFAGLGNGPGRVQLLPPEAVVPLEGGRKALLPSKAEEPSGSDPPPLPAKADPDGPGQKPQVQPPIPADPSPPREPEAEDSHPFRTGPLPPMGQNPATVEGLAVRAWESLAVQEEGERWETDRPVSAPPPTDGSGGGEVKTGLRDSTPPLRTEGTGLPTKSDSQPSRDAPGGLRQEGGQGSARTASTGEGPRSEVPRSETGFPERDPGKSKGTPPPAHLPGSARGGEQVELHGRSEGVRLARERLEYDPLPNRLRLEFPDRWGEPVRMEVRGRSDAVWARVEGGLEVARMVRAHESALHHALSERGVALLGLEVGVLAQGDGRAPGTPESPEAFWLRPARARSPTGERRRKVGAVDYVV